MHEGMIFRIGALRYRVKEINDGNLPENSNSASLCENTPIYSEN